MSESEIGTVTGERRFQALLQRCVGKLYNEQIDRGAKEFARHDTMSMVQNVATYPRLDELPGMRRRQDESYGPLSPEPVRGSLKIL